MIITCKIHLSGQQLLRILLRQNLFLFLLLWQYLCWHNHFQLIFFSVKFCSCHLLNNTILVNKTGKYSFPFLTKINSPKILILLTKLGPICSWCHIMMQTILFYCDWKNPHTELKYITERIYFFIKV